MNAPTTKAEGNAIDAARLAHYTDMARKAMQPQAAPRAELLLAGYLYRGISFDIFGAGNVEDGCTIESVCASGDGTDLYPLLEGSAIYKMAAACDRAALESRNESQCNAMAAA